MAVYLAPTFGAGYQAFDTNGLPLNGGFISTFAAGTATPLATWTTSTGLVANPTSITLGTDGRPPNEIWLTGATTYLFQLFTSTGVSIKSYDNLYGINDPAVVGTNASAIWAIAAGTVNAITATYTPANASLTDGLILGVRMAGANTTTTPTFSPDGLAAHTITKEGGVAVSLNEWNSLSEILLRYNLANTRWEILNPVGVQGTFTGTITGMTAVISSTCVYSITNNVVTLNMPAMQGTSSSAAMALTGLPAAITPTNSHNGFACLGNDGSTTQTAPIRADITNTSTIAFSKLWDGTGFATSGTKGIQIGATFTYNLN